MGIAERVTKPYSSLMRRQNAVSPHEAESMLAFTFVAEKRYPDHRSI
jgi:hypothetical protein